MATFRKFAHRATLDYFRRGKIRVQCECGKLSPVFTTHVEPCPDCDNGKYEDGTECMLCDGTGIEVVRMEQLARMWYEAHTGLKEVKPQKRG